MPIKSKKILKIVTGIIIFLTLPSLLFFGFLYFKYNEDLPTGIKGEKADALAYKMLKALNYEAYKSTNYIEWTFKKRHHYKWEKAKNICEVYWKEYKVNLDLKNYSNSKVYVHGFIIDSELKVELIEKAIKYFNNDSFWLVAPYKVFDNGVERRLVTLENNTEALLITYKTGGSTPGDSYLWLLDNAGKPKAFKMWTSILPIDGLEASWADWTTLDSGAQLPTFHKLLLLGIEITDIKT
tara:strand:+ start:10686 stop:11402 length:717 start_codon:yes stop_codon:yes gene_type:complete